MTPNKPQGMLPSDDQTQAAAERAADAAENAVHASRRVANDALDHVESAIHSARANVQPAISRLATQAESLARKGLDAVKDGAYTVRDRATSLTDVTARYVKDEPVKAVLIAAAAGAALMALLSLAQSGRRRDDL